MRMILGLFSVFVILLNPAFGQYRRSDENTPSRGRTIKAVGANKFDLLMQYLGVASELAPKKLARAMGRKSIIDAHQSSIPYLRISAAGYCASDAQIWRDDPEVFWEAFDQMMEDLNKYQVKAILVLGWNIMQFSQLEKEDFRDFLLNPDSLSQAYFLRFTKEVITRYRDHPALLFWELTNEWNLDADLDSGKANDNFSTDELIIFSREISAFIKSLDSCHPLSSGYSLPKPSAEHLRRQPGWSPQGPDWTEDTAEEFARHLLDLHESFDIVSIHIYNSCLDSLCDRRDNERLGWRGKYETGLLEFIKATTDQAGKMLFVGEFCDGDPYLREGLDAQFSQKVLEKIVELRIPFSAVWVWEFYQHHLSLPYPQQAQSLEPGLTDSLIEKIKDANRLLGTAAPEKQWPDETPPQVLIIHPFDGKGLGFLSRVTAVTAAASDDDRVVSVDFWLDDRWLARLIKPPFTFMFGGAFGLAPGTYRLKAVAMDASGNRSSDLITVFVP